MVNRPVWKDGPPCPLPHYREAEKRRTKLMDYLQIITPLRGGFDQGWEGIGRRTFLAKTYCSAPNPLPPW